MRHSIGSKQQVTKGKILSPPRGTHKEFTNSKLATARVSKGKSSEKSIPGIGRPSPSTTKVTAIPPKKPCISMGDDEEQPSTDIPSVPVLISPPPFGPHACQMPSPTQLANTTLTDKPNSDGVSGTDVITSVAADPAYNALTNVPRTRAATPMLPSRPGSVPGSGPPPREPESATVSPDLLLTQSSQNTGSQPEPTNQNSQVSDSSQIHRMTLKYSNEEITDEELREINLQTAAHQYKMQSDAQQKNTPTPFQKTPSSHRPVSPSECSIPDI